MFVIQIEFADNTQRFSAVSDFRDAVNKAYQVVHYGAVRAMLCESDRDIEEWSIEFTYDTVIEQCGSYVSTAHNVPEVIDQIVAGNLL